MQKIDQEKLSEFTSELSTFQTEASKTASIDVYDRFTISKLEDHVVDLCQLSMDASHPGLQYLCERLRDNIRDHFITGTNISDDEFSLMAEWKSLVKAYLLDNENEKIVNALATNLSKPAWTYPLNSNDTEEVVTVLLGRSSISNNDSVTIQTPASVDVDSFDALMEESNTSLADVFESFSEDDNNDDESLVSPIEDEESSIAAFFEDTNDFQPSEESTLESSSDHSELDTPATESLAGDLHSADESIENVEVSEQELDAIEKSVSESLADELYVADESADDSEYSEEFDKDLSNAEAAFAATADEAIEKVEVSAQELAAIENSVPESVTDESTDDSEYSEEFDKDFSNSKAAFASTADEAIEKVEVSAQELEAIENSVPESVADESTDDSEYSGEFDKDLSHTEVAFTDSPDASIEKVEVSEQELAAIENSVPESVVDELYVADESDDESHDSEEFDKDLSHAEAAFTDSPDVSIENVEVSAQELEAIENSVSESVVDELYVADEGTDDSEYSEEFDKDLLNAEAVIADSADASVEKIEVPEQELAAIEKSVPMSLADELYVSDDNIDKESLGSQDLPIGTIEVTDQAHEDSYKEEIGSSTEEVEILDIDNDNSQEENQSDEFESESVSPPETVYMEPASQKPEPSRSIIESYIGAIANNDNDKSTEEKHSALNASSKKDDKEIVVKDSDEGNTIDDSDSDLSQEESLESNTQSVSPESAKSEAPRSIIEAYVGVIADKIRGNKPKELEKALIQETPKPPPIQKLEPVDSILLKYPDWSEEQKELLSLILSEVHDVIDQQDEVLSVLHQDEIVEQDVLDMVSLYSEQIERMGSAAEMVGLDALQKLCELIDFHFGDLQKSSTEMIVSSEKRIRKWPFIIYEYLKNIHNEKSHQEAIDYISDDDWARTIREDIKSDLKEAFSYSTIQIEKTEADERSTEASQEDVDITIPDDVQAELLDGLLQELPHQAEEFSEAIQQLIENDYLVKLEIAQRIAHTIKGAANTVGIVGVATLTHHLEDILQALLKAQAKPSSHLHTGLVDASDCLEQMTEYLLGQGDQPDGALQTMQVILDWANYIDEFGPPQDDADLSLPAVNAEQSAQEKTPEVKEESNKVKPSQDVSLRVSANMIDELINQSGESIIATSQMHENVDKLLMSMRDIKKNKDNVYSLSQQLEHLIDVQGASDKFSGNKENEKFDPLELDQYNELHTYSRRLIEATADSVELISELEDRLYSLESVIVDQARAQKDNQYAILKTRMMPVESVVARLKRGVRQAAKISGKSVELEIEGVDILLDSKILNNLIDPLMHLLRNAVDHGIESDDIREANGKSVPGIIKLSFAQLGERLEINCQDDGKGLNAEEIKNRAIEKGMILNEQELTDDEIHQIIMQHGFSTRDEVTQLSGRGVGMDVVYSNIKELNGSVKISSELGKSMNVELSLPVSLLTAHALLIPTVSGSMAVSASAIEEILHVNVDDLKETEQGLMLQVEENEYPAVHLEQLLQMRLSSASNKQQSYTALLIKEFAGQKKVVLVSEIQSVRDIIIKPLSQYLPKAVGLVGATVLGNGDIAPVVDVADLLSEQSNVIGMLDMDHSAELEEVHQASVLVVEDSISTRRSLAEFMQDLNYKVLTAKDGVEAIEIMRDHSPTLLLTDLEMPRMNGLELTSYVRSHDETKDIPIIMLTSRTTEKHRKEAKSIGVNEYLSKPFVEDLLLEKVQSLAIHK